jgi:hypothetical protein
VPPAARQAGAPVRPTAPVYLRHRPKHVAPVLVSGLNEAETLARDPHSPEPAYDYVRRAEYHVTPYSTSSDRGTGERS